MTNAVHSLLISLTILTAASLITTNTAYAQTRYVHDELVITVRSGESSQHKILRTIKSGTALELLESHPDTGYSLIRLKDGTEGWVLSRYLTRQPIAKTRLATARRELQQAQLQNRNLEQALSQTQQQLQKSEARNASLLKRVDDLEKEINRIRNLAGHAPALSEQNQALKADLIRLETLVQTLEQENMLIKDRSARDWFIAGTGVTLMGMAMGFVAHKIRSRKRSSWREL